MDVLLAASLDPVRNISFLQSPESLDNPAMGMHICTCGCVPIRICACSCMYTVHAQGVYHAGVGSRMRRMGAGDYWEQKADLLESWKSWLGKHLLLPTLTLSASLSLSVLFPRLITPSSLLHYSSL